LFPGSTYLPFLHNLIIDAYRSIVKKSAILGACSRAAPEGCVDWCVKASRQSLSFHVRLQCWTVLYYFVGIAVRIGVGVVAKLHVQLAF
jgi:hypothetical protein